MVMQKWQYKIIGYVNRIDMDMLGDEGWELVAVTGIINPANRSTSEKAYFKRPLTNGDKETS